MFNCIYFSNVYRFLRFCANLPGTSTFGGQTLSLVYGSFPSEASVPSSRGNCLHVNLETWFFGCESAGRKGDTQCSSQGRMEKPLQPGRHIYIYINSTVVDLLHLCNFVGLRKSREVTNPVVNLAEATGKGNLGRMNVEASDSSRPRQKILCWTDRTRWART